jgi:hypothetical protein
MRRTAMCRNGGASLPGGQSNTQSFASPVMSCASSAWINRAATRCTPVVRWAVNLPLR